MNLDLSIIDLIENYVKEIAKDEWAEDDCPPEFWVSVNGYEDKQKVLLTINHLGFKFTKVLFPSLTATYGYGKIREEMKHLYSRTM